MLDWCACYERECITRYVCDGDYRVRTLVVKQALLFVEVGRVLVTELLCLTLQRCALLHVLLDTSHSHTHGPQHPCST